MPDPHERSIASALKTVIALGKLSDRLRGKNSAIHRAYRTVLRVLRGNTDNVQLLVDALATLQNSIRAAASDYYGDALDIGSDQAERDLRIYGLGAPDSPDPNSAGVALAATIGFIEQQSEQAIAVARLDMGDEYILGDDTRQGILAPSLIIGEMAFWLTSLSMVSYLAGINREMPCAVRQAVAQIDEHTTQTCLNIHGETVAKMVGKECLDQYGELREMSESFRLTGTPRYADVMHAPPFHRGCRTAIATFPPEYLKDSVTKEMRHEAVVQGKQPKPSTLKGRAHYKVVGKSVLEFRQGRWHKYKRYDTNIAARTEAARLNKARRS